MTAERENIHLQSELARLSAVNLFCWVTAACATPYLFFLQSSGDYLSLGVMLGIIFCFLFSTWLNKTGQISPARFLIVFTTNFSVLYFSTRLGYNSGIHLYLCTSPLIVYLLFDFRLKWQIIFCLSCYFLTFILVYLQSRYDLFPSKPMGADFTRILYGLNFCFTLLISFFLIIYFANNNAAYNLMLQERNEFLLIHQSALMTQIADRVMAEAKLIDLLEEKNILLSEIHHRVKNNLAVVSGLLELQCMNLEDEKAKSVLVESRNRIKSLALIHESLYQHENLASIHLDNYLSRLLPEISHAYTGISGTVKLEITVASIELELSQAIPCSLLLNELVSNAYKHAFQDRLDGILSIVGSLVDGEIYLLVKDNGNGLPIPTARRKDSLGMILIQTFVQQLKGRLESRNDGGAVFEIWFPYMKGK
jgi:two-component sensor histidine kinase